MAQTTPTTHPDPAMLSQMVDHDLTRDAAHDLAALLSGTACVEAQTCRYAALPWGGRWAVVRRDLTPDEARCTLAGILTQSEG